LGCGTSLINQARIKSFIGTQDQIWDKWFLKAEFPPNSNNWYSNDQLIQLTPPDHYTKTCNMKGYSGGLILMTKQQAYEMGMTPQQVINWYNEDKLFYESAKKTNTKPSLFFEYRKDGSITGKYKPPIVPPTTPATPPPVMTPPTTPATPPPVMTPPEPTPAPVAEPTPAPAIGNLNPYQLKTTIDPKWILLAIVGVGILSAMIFILRGRK